MLGADPSLEEQALDAAKKSGDGFLLAVALAVVAYRVGRARGAREHLPAPSVSSMFAGYVGLRAFDALFGKIGR